MLYAYGLKPFYLTQTKEKLRVDQEIIEKTDGELIALSLKNSEAFGPLVDRYEAKLFRYVRRFSGLEKEGVEDVLQEAFIKIYTNLNDYNPKFTFSAWAYRITHNEAINYLRKNKKQIILPLETEDKETLSLIDALQSDANIAEEISNKDFIERTRQAINMLPEKYREVLVLRYMEDLEYQEISDILRIPMGTVATMINRAKEKFKKIALKMHLDEKVA